MRDESERAASRPARPGLPGAATGLPRLQQRGRPVAWGNASPRSASARPPIPGS